MNNSTKTINSIKESEICDIMSQATMNPDYWEGKLAYKTCDEYAQNINLVSADNINYAEPIFGSVLSAIAATLGKMKKQKETMALSFVDNCGSFIAAFWIEFDNDSKEWIAGGTFDQNDLKKIEKKNVKPHTEVTYFYIEPNSEIQKFIYDSTGFEFAQSAEIINRIILEVLITLKFFMTINAPEGEQFIFHINQTVNKDICSAELAASLGDEVVLDIATAKSQKSKNGVDITFEFGQYSKFYIKDHGDETVTVE